MCLMPACSSVRTFAVYPKVVAPRSNLQLEEIGRSNLALTKEFGLDYNSIVFKSAGALSGNASYAENYRSFEDEIN